MFIYKMHEFIISWLRLFFLHFSVFFRVAFFQYINWLQAADPKFRQNRMDSFHITTKSLGTLKKVTIGHDHIGYGIFHNIYLKFFLCRCGCFHRPFDRYGKR